VGGTQGRERFGESFNGASQDEELEDEEERDPNHAISASYTTHETDARTAEKPTHNTPSKSAAWDTVRRLTSRGVEHLALLSAVLAHVYLRVHETSPGVHCNTPLSLNRGKGSAGVTSAFVTHDAMHQTRIGQTPYTSHYGHRRAAGWRACRQGGRERYPQITRQGPPGCVQHDPRPDTTPSRLSRVRLR
jgi:hypothetical protein